MYGMTPKDKATQGYSMQCGQNPLQWPTRKNGGIDGIWSTRLKYYEPKPKGKKPNTKSLGSTVQGRFVGSRLGAIRYSSFGTSVRNFVCRVPIAHQAACPKSNTVAFLSARRTSDSEVSCVWGVVCVTPDKCEDKKSNAPKARIDAVLLQAVGWAKVYIVDTFRTHSHLKYRMVGSQTRGELQSKRQSFFDKVSTKIKLHRCRVWHHCTPSTPAVKPTWRTWRRTSHVKDKYAGARVGARWGTGRRHMLCRT